MSNFLFVALNSLYFLRNVTSNSLVGDVSVNVCMCACLHLCLSVLSACLYTAAYPLHFHMLHDATGNWFRNNSVHHSLASCVTVHGTNNVEVGVFTINSSGTP